MVSARPFAMGRAAMANRRAAALHVSLFSLSNRSLGIHDAAREPAPFLVRRKS